MVAKTSVARRRAFFTALAETGNQTLAAERAKVSRSWVSLHRAQDPAFRVELEQTIATAKVALVAAGSVGPDRRWGHQAGEELCVRGSNGRRTQIARARVRQWTPRVEARFLSALAATCNVKAACAVVGLSQASAYAHFQRWPGFAQRWGEALKIGYERIDGALIESAGRFFGDHEYQTDEPLPPMSADQVLQLLRLHERQARGTGGRPGRISRRPLPTQAEVDAALTVALDRVGREMARAASKRASRSRR